MSGVFVSNIPEPQKRRPKAADSCYRSEARGREEISRSFCSSPGASFPARRRSPCRETSPDSPKTPACQVRRTGLASRQSGLMPCHSPRSPTMAPASQSSCIPRPSTSRRSKTDTSQQAANTLSAIDSALRAVEAVEALRADEAMKSMLAAGDCSPSVNEDLESLCGTECTESTACSSSLSEDGGVGLSRKSFSLSDARKTLKERIGAQQRSMRFTDCILTKLDELRDAVAEEGSKAKKATSRRR